MNYKKISVYLIAFGSLIIIAIYGISFLSSPEKLAFKELSRGQAELELQPEKKKLEILRKKVEDGVLLTEDEKRVAMGADEKIETVREEYSKGNLVPPPPKIAAKPKEE